MALALIWPSFGGRRPRLPRVHAALHVAAACNIGDAGGGAGRLSGPGARAVRVPGQVHMHCHGPRPDLAQFWRQTASVAACTRSGSAGLKKKKKKKKKKKGGNARARAQRTPCALFCARRLAMPRINGSHHLSHEASANVIRTSSVIHCTAALVVLAVAVASSCLAPQPAAAGSAACAPVLPASMRGLDCGWLAKERPARALAEAGSPAALSCATTARNFECPRAAAAPSLPLWLQPVSFVAPSPPLWRQTLTAFLVGPPLSIFPDSHPTPETTPESSPPGKTPESSRTAAPRGMTEALRWYAFRVLPLKIDVFSPPTRSVRGDVPNVSDMLLIFLRALICGYFADDVGCAVVSAGLVLVLCLLYIPALAFDACTYAVTYSTQYCRWLVYICVRLWHFPWRVWFIECSHWLACIGVRVTHFPRRLWFSPSFWRAIFSFKFFNLVINHFFGSRPQQHFAPRPRAPRRRRPRSAARRGRSGAPSPARPRTAAPPDRSGAPSPARPRTAAPPDRREPPSSACRAAPPRCGFNELGRALVLAALFAPAAAMDGNPAGGAAPTIAVAMAAAAAAAAAATYAAGAGAAAPAGARAGAGVAADRAAPFEYERDRLLLAYPDTMKQLLSDTDRFNRLAAQLRKAAASGDADAVSTYEEKMGDFFRIARDLEVTLAIAGVRPSPAVDALGAPPPPPPPYVPTLPPLLAPTMSPPLTASPSLPPAGVLAPGMAATTMYLSQPTATSVLAAVDAYAASSSNSATLTAKARDAVGADRAAGGAGRPLDAWAQFHLDLLAAWESPPLRPSLAAPHRNFDMRYWVARAHWLSTASHNSAADADIIAKRLRAALPLQDFTARRLIAAALRALSASAAPTPTPAASASARALPSLSAHLTAAAAAGGGGGARAPPLLSVAITAGGGGGGARAPLSQPLPTTGGGAALTSPLPMMVFSPDGSVGAGAAAAAASASMAPSSPPASPVTKPRKCHRAGGGGRGSRSAGAHASPPPSPASPPPHRSRRSPSRAAASAAGVDQGVVFRVRCLVQTNP